MELYKLPTFLSTKLQLHHKPLQQLTSLKAIFNVLRDIKKKTLNFLFMFEVVIYDRIF